MSQSQMTLHLVPAPGTLEHQLLIEILAQMARVWLDSEHCEREGGAQATEITDPQAGQEMMQ